MTDIQEPNYGHFIQPNGLPYTKESMAMDAAQELKHLRDQHKPSLPSDGSSGQYDAWTQMLVASITGYGNR
jgi:hypothetical protein